MTFDWTSPYSQWSPDMQAQAKRFLIPKLQNGGAAIGQPGSNWGSILGKARELGVSGDSLSQALQASGSPWGDRTTGLLRNYAPDLFQTTPFTGYGTTAGRQALFGYGGGVTPFFSAVQSAGINPYFAKASAGAYDAGTTDPTQAFTAGQQFVTNRFADRYGLSANQSNQSYRSANRTAQELASGQRRFQSDLGRGEFGRQFGGAGGILGMPTSTPPAYPMAQYAPQFNWQQLGGLLGQRAFGG